MIALLKIVLAVIVSSLLLSAIMLFIISTFPRTNAGNKTWAIATLIGATGYGMMLAQIDQQPSMLGEMIFFTFTGGWGIGMHFGSMQILELRTHRYVLPLLTLVVTMLTWLLGIYLPETNYFAWLFCALSAGILLHMAWAFFKHSPVMGWPKYMLVFSLAASGLHLLNYPLTRASEFAPFGFLIAVLLLLPTYIALNTIALIQFRKHTEASEQAAHQVSVLDPLTGLHNRLSLPGVFQQAIDMSKKTASGFTLLFLDLDDFKQINDTHGHAAGDQVLKTIAERLRKIMEGQGHIARLGGDEFLMLIRDTRQANSTHLRQLLAQMEEAACTPVVYDAKEYAVGISIGASHYPSSGKTLGELMAIADKAMYEDKRLKKAFK